MRSKTIFGALLVSVAMCSQGFGFELLDRMLGLNSGGCGECKACAKVAACEPCAKVACAEPACCEKATCGHCKKCRITPVRDLFDGLKDMFEAKGVQCEPVACEAAKGCCPEPCAKAACCEPCKVKKCHKVRCEKACGACCPATCEKACEKPCAPVACEPVCEPKCHKLYRRPLVELLESLFGDCRSKCGTCEVAGCDTGCGCGGTTVPGKAPAVAPDKAPGEKAAPLPVAPNPKPDASAAIPSRGIYQASRSLVRN
jgi:hypothetical protein